MRNEYTQAQFYKRLYPVATTFGVQLRRRHSVQGGNISHNLSLWNAFTCIGGTQRTSRLFTRNGFTQCQRLFQDGTLSLRLDKPLHGIRANETTTRSITLAGRINNNGSCKGVQFSDPYGIWNDVVVQGVVKITL